VSLIQSKAFVFWYGAIAQLGERVLCKHEVVGSIPSGSTSLRWLRQLGLGEPTMQADNSEGCRVAARRAKTGLLPKQNRPRNITSHALSYTGRACGISDIVKRRLIRVWDLRSNSQEPITISGTFRRSFIAR
jgi:hypothetical protein